MIKKKILIVAPFYNLHNNVGNYRIRRFIKWLKSSHEIIVVSAGPESKIEKKSWGTNFVIKDNISFITKLLVSKKILKPLHIIWNTILYYFIVPDNYFYWAKKIVNQIDISENIDFVLSSSPQNSSHIGAFLISKKKGIKHFADFRDGWIDEPLRPIINKWKWRKKAELKWESKIINNAERIFVTSQNWKDMMGSRYNNNHKIDVLTNAYPSVDLSAKKKIDVKGEVIKLIYTGNFTVFRKQKLLFEPLIKYASQKSLKMELTLLGNYRKKDLIELRGWQIKCRDVEIGLKIMEHLPREEMFNELLKNNALILLSASYGAIPSKIFEFIPLEKPILAITQYQGAVWGLAKNIPQIFLYNYLREDDGNDNSLENFFNATLNHNFESVVPKEYYEDSLKRSFFNSINQPSIIS